MTEKPRFNPLLFLVTWGSVAYVLALCGILYSMEHCTEHQWWFGAMVYLPPEILLAPLVILLPLALLLRPAVCLLHVAAVAAVFFGFHHEYSAATVADFEKDRPSLKVITANIGQRKVGPLQKFIIKQDPDVIAFQERIYTPREFRAENPGYNVRVEGEFTLASKLPIRKSGLVPDLTFEGRPVAAWFELSLHGRPVVIYSVHMPTPRTYLLDLQGDGLLAGFSQGTGIFSPEVRAEYQAYWSTRFELARGLLCALQQETRPLLVVGDFNTPDHGGLYRMFASELTDGFAAAGSGGGETFPGNTSGHLAALGPWLRLDYQFAGKNWRPIEAMVEPHQKIKAQHLALMTSYEFVESESSPTPLARTESTLPAQPSVMATR